MKSFPSGKTSSVKSLLFNRRHVPSLGSRDTCRRKCMTIRRSTPTAAIAMVDVQEPCHGGAPSSAKAVVAARNELDVPAIAEILKLLADFGADVLIARIESAQDGARTRRLRRE